MLLRNYEAISPEIYWEMISTPTSKVSITRLTLSLHETKLVRIITTRLMSRRASIVGHLPRADRRKQANVDYRRWYYRWSHRFSYKSSISYLRFHRYPAEEDLRASILAPNRSENSNLLRICFEFASTKLFHQIIRVVRIRVPFPTFRATKLKGVI